MSAQKRISSRCARNRGVRSSLTPLLRCGYCSYCAKWPRSVRLRYMLLLDAGPPPSSRARDASRLRSPPLCESLSDPLFARVRKRGRTDSLAEEVFRPYLRSGSELDSVAWYIWLNPVRKEIVDAVGKYPFAGSFTNAQPFRHQPANIWEPNWKTKDNQ
jgi:hypothetical protein